VYRRKGQLRVIAGPMCCGKSEETMRELRRAVIAGRRVLLLRPALDTRTAPDEARSRSGVTFPARTLSSSAEILPTVAAEDADFVAIEEGQFWDEGIVRTAQTMVGMQLVVVINGLNQDYLGRPFGQMPTIMALADEVRVLTAICQVCGEEATKTQRLHADGTPAGPDEQLILPGGFEQDGMDRYEARCRRHHVIGAPHSRRFHRHRTSVDTPAASPLDSGPHSE
jgi:thymidine kinase